MKQCDSKETNVKTIAGTVSNDNGNSSSNMIAMAMAMY
jgi:hypothetical protein